MRQNSTDINLEDFFCMKYAQIIKNLELNQNKEPFDFLLFPHTVKKTFSPQYPHAKSKTSDLVGFIFYFQAFYIKKVFGLILN